jgi:hypothetical protein
MEGRARCVTALVEFFFFFLFFGGLYGCFCMDLLSSLGVWVYEFQGLLLLLLLLVFDGVGMLFVVVFGWIPLNSPLHAPSITGSPFPN